MIDFLGATINGILIAGLYTMMSFGLALIYGVMKLVNLAHAGFIMLGAYATFALFSRFGMDPFLATIIAGPLFFLIGMALHRYVVRRLPESGNTPAVQSLLLLFGVWLVLQNLGYYIWGGDTRSVLTSYTMSAVNIGPFRLSVVSLLVFAMTSVIGLAMTFMLTRTYLGKAIRAVTQNKGAAMLVGINAGRIQMIAFGLGIALGALAGGLMSTIYPFTPDFGRSFLLKGFVITVLAGMESFWGVAFGAAIIALIEQYTAQYNLVPNIFQDAITFGLLVVALVVMPQGLPSVGSQIVKFGRSLVARLLRRREVARS
ncbi:MAG TPA: branched-chain amino acid ABC transporter permease [Symbiobacteriaceae bacterium]|nr:branched-chain amino acid ABC transporter permease [Symbiobacteriaceae bacterium]